jgi:hypothetical protein
MIPSGASMLSWMSSGMEKHDSGISSLTLIYRSVLSTILLIYLLWTFSTSTGITATLTSVMALILYAFRLSLKFTPFLPDSSSPL